MSSASPPSNGAATDWALDAASTHYQFRLYVTDASPTSARAVVNARRLFEAHLKDRYQLEILSITEHIAQAAEDQVVATPTLIRILPTPRCRFIGDLSRTEGVLRSIGGDVQR